MSDKKIIEITPEEAAGTQQLTDLLNEKAKEKFNLEKLKGLNLLKKSKFYYSTNGELREHISTYNGYAILLKQENLKEEINDKEDTIFPSIVTIEDLRKMKKVNGNKVRKIQPKSLHEWEKMALVQGVIHNIDKGI